MLTTQECLEFCDLTEEEILEIAEHEHLPDVVAAELGECLLGTDVGTRVIKRILLENLGRAEEQGHHAKVARLSDILGRFDKLHPSYDLRPQGPSRRQTG